MISADKLDDHALTLSISHNNSQLTIQLWQTFWYHNTISLNHNIQIGIRKSITNSTHKLRSCISTSELLDES